MVAVFPVFVSRRAACAGGGVQKELVHTMTIHPRFLGAQLLKTLQQQLKDEVEGKNVHGGYVVKVCLCVCVSLFLSVCVCV